MTVGKDVSSLFTDVLNCVQTGNIELKKLVYLYLINYAKTQPELTLLAVNTFVKDANDPNPLIRALAVRTMGCIRVDRITEYLCEPLSRALRDEDPYVRKTAAVCVAKLYDIAPGLVAERGFLETLHDLISDSNPSVVANSVAALSEIAETSGKDVMKISAAVLQKLLAALNECTEWGQVFILDSLAKYSPADGREAEGIIERVTPRLQHANSAVVMSAVKVILSYMEAMRSNPDGLRALTRKLAPPLVTLLNSEPEIQYVALRNINLIVQKRPAVLENEIKVFFCKYNDPIYVKMEKLEIMIKLVSERNVEQVLLELKEYSTEVDVDFVRKSVSAIGRCAVKLDRAAERCIGVLLELIQTKVNYIVQESVIVIKDIFRRYPNRYESIIATLCDNLVHLCLNKFKQHTNAALCCSFEFNSASTNRRNGLTDEIDVNLSRVFLKFKQDLINILFRNQLDDDFKFLHLHINGVIVLAEKYLDFVFQNMRSFLDNKIDVSKSNILDFRFRIQKSDKRWR